MPRKTSVFKKAQRNLKDTAKNEINDVDELISDVKEYIDKPLF